MPSAKSKMKKDSRGRTAGPWVGEKGPFQRKADVLAELYESRAKGSLGSVTNNYT